MVSVVAITHGVVPCVLWCSWDRRRPCVPHRGSLCVAQGVSGLVPGAPRGATARLYRSRRASSCKPRVSLGAVPAPGGVPLPIGPLSPCHSDFWAQQAFDGYADSMEAKQKSITNLMMKMQMGTRLEPGEAAQLCSDMREANDMWLTSNMRMRYAEDFQAAEFFKVGEAMLLRDGVSMDAIEALMRWQPLQMEAQFNGRPPPPLPPGVDRTALQRASQKASVMGTLTSAPQVSAPVFAEDSSVYDSPVVKDEYEALMRDHQQLISFGSGYRSFDPMGKEAFLDQLALVEDRWRVFFGRAQLMGSVNPLYVEQCGDYFRRFGSSADEFGRLLEEAHSLMRADAAREGLQR